MFRYIALILAFVAIIGLAEDHGNAAVILKEKNFDTEVKKFPHFVMFFAPWCGHCKKLGPTWQELAKKFNNDKNQTVAIAKVDCTVEKTLCQKQNIKGYPTIKLFKPGKEGENYSGGRSLEALTDHLTFPSPPKNESVISLSRKEFDLATKHDTPHFVMFFAPWCGHCKRLAPSWNKLAQSLKEENQSVTISKVDCTVETDICNAQKVSGYPTLKFINQGVISDYHGGRSTVELKEYVMSMLKSRSTLRPKESSHVLRLNGTTFEKSIKHGLSFIKFIKTKCEHCERLAQRWEELADLYIENEDVKISEFDCSEESEMAFCKEKGVTNFPTLVLYKNGEKISNYKGKQTLKALDEFIKAWMEEQSKKTHAEL